MTRLVSETCPEIIIGVRQTRNPWYFVPQCHNVDRHRVIVNLLIVLFPIALQSMNLDMKEPPTICRYVSSEELFFPYLFFVYWRPTRQKHIQRPSILGLLSLWPHHQTFSRGPGIFVPSSYMGWMFSWSSSPENPCNEDIYIYITICHY